MNIIRKSSVLYIVIPICLTIVIFILWYGYPFKKFTDQNLKVYQLALTAFAATVGIGTVVNSSKSTELSRKSIKMTQDKESREQSSHLVFSSQISTFKMSPPMYKEDHVYSPNTYVETTLHDLIYSLYDSPESYSELKKEFKKSLISIQEERIDEESKLNTLHLLNIGKGVCLNVEYNFEFVNLDEFNYYSVLYDVDKQGDYDVVAPTKYPSYDLSVEKRKGYLKITTMDHTVNYLAGQALMNEDEKYHYSVLDANYVSSDQITYIPFIKPGKNVHLPIPNEFMVLCKHYSIMSLYKRQDSKSRISSFVRPTIQHLIEEEAISPIGKITISYLDEEDVKLKGNMSIRKKLILMVVIKDSSIYRHGENIQFYLEFTPAPKIQSKTKKKRAYS
ncbi:hypothetical protein QNN95_07360 [Exiguobacterium acetylicum]|uniref:hypothetical protein n=1 Tax=Exiguobacterium acetylicum TaxID=41170 RepID=UPI0035A65D57